jgi:hypothetical protein
VAAGGTGTLLAIGRKPTSSRRRGGEGGRREKYFILTRGKSEFRACGPLIVGVS